jgi:hypothetical protein
MIRFRQKNFVGWMIPTMIGTTGLTMWQTHEQGKEQEKQSEETQAALDRQTKALNKIAKEAKSNPELAQQVVQQKQMSERIKLFAAIPSGTMKNLGGFAKDMWKTQKGNVMKAGKAGLGFGAMTYAGNRITTSLKDHDEGNDKKNLGFLGKAALAGVTIGGTYLAAKKGKLGAKPIEALGGKTGSQAIQGGIEKVGRAINPIQRKDGKIDKLATGLNAGFVAMPMVGYLGQRQQIKDQAKQTEKAYSDDSETGGTGKKLLKIGTGILGTAGALVAAKHGKLGAGAQRFVGNSTAQIGGILKAAGATKLGDKMAKSGSQTFAKGFRMKGKDPRFAGKAVSEATQQKIADAKYIRATDPNKISGGFNKASSFIGFYGKGGTKAVQNTANTLANSENAISQKVGKFMQNHKTTANVGAGVGSIAAGGTIMDAAAKPFKVLDKHAYDYEEEQNKQVE